MCIRASGKAVIRSGNAVSQALGTPDKPGPVLYAGAMNRLSHSSFGNSNSAAYAVADRAVKSEDPNAFQPLPPGTRNPGWEQSDHIPSVTVGDYIVGER